ncbi:hypothetical protein ACQSED_24485 [Salmonella enterica]|uniref:hypothetical protein n=1 Tax=Salmonella enterica TaxID=28901 RepID=UPI003D312077
MMIMAGRRVHRTVTEHKSAVTPPHNEGGGASAHPPSAPQARGLFRRGQTGARFPVWLTAPFSAADTRLSGTVRRQKVDDGA